MMRSKHLLLNSVVILALGFPGFTKTPIVTGKMVAYNPLRHAGKVASYEANKEEVILETPARKKGFVKVVFISYGTTQIDPKYFDGTIPLEVHVLRDHECDEKLPTHRRRDESRSKGRNLSADRRLQEQPAPQDQDSGVL